MSTQTGLFDPAPIMLNSSVRKSDVPRLSAQHARYIEAFRRAGWEMTNVSLSAISIRYSARLAEMRKHGIKWSIIDRDGATGVCTYRMEPQPEVER